MQTKLNIGPHLSEEILEEYAFERLGERQLAPVEEHLLVCEDCRQLLAGVDQYIRLMKNSSGTLAPETPQRRARPWRYAASGAIAAGLALAFYLAPPEPSIISESVSLVALRGAEMAHIHAGHAADFRIALNDLPDAEYRITIVDSHGRLVWSGPAESAERKLRVREPKALSSGIYWIRLYSSDGELMREFGLDSSD